MIFIYLFFWFVIVCNFRRISLSPFFVYFSSYLNRSSFSIKKLQLIAVDNIMGIIKHIGVHAMSTYIYDIHISVGRLTQF